jgi:hypothetical protein
LVRQEVGSPATRGSWLPPPSCPCARSPPNAAALWTRGLVGPSRRRVPPTLAAIGRGRRSSESRPCVATASKRPPVRGYPSWRRQARVPATDSGSTEPSTWLETYSYCIGRKRHRRWPIKTACAGSAHRLDARRGHPALGDPFPAPDRLIHGPAFWPNPCSRNNIGSFKRSSIIR